MMRSLYSGVSGLRNHQTRMDVIGNNIANINTFGFKSSRVSFSDIMSQTMRSGTSPDAYHGGINPVQVGLGMGVASIGQRHLQGSIMTTGMTTDLAIEGDGFFIVSDGAEEYYTRTNMFQFDGMGRLVDPSSGFVLQGTMANEEGELTASGSLGDIELPFGQKFPARATTDVNWTGNLDASVFPTESILQSSRVLSIPEESDSIFAMYNGSGLAHDIADGDQVHFSCLATDGTGIQNLYNSSGTNLGLDMGDTIVVSAKLDRIESAVLDKDDFRATSFDLDLTVTDNHTGEIDQATVTIPPLENMTAAEAVDLITHAIKTEGLPITVTDEGSSWSLTPLNQTTEIAWSGPDPETLSIGLPTASGANVPFYLTIDLAVPDFDSFGELLDQIAADLNTTMGFTNQISVIREDDGTLRIQNDHAAIDINVEIRADPENETFSAAILALQGELNAEDRSGRSDSITYQNSFIAGDDFGDLNDLAGQLEESLQEVSSGATASLTTDGKISYTNVSGADSYAIRDMEITVSPTNRPLFQRALGLDNEDLKVGDYLSSDRFLRTAAELDLLTDLYSASGAHLGLSTGDSIEFDFAIGGVEQATYTARVGTNIVQYRDLADWMDEKLDTQSGTGVTIQSDGSLYVMGDPGEEDALSSMSLTESGNEVLQDAMAFTTIQEAEDATSTASVVTYDSLGNTHTVILTFNKSEIDNYWTWEATLDSDGTVLRGNEGSITFNPDGSLATFQPNDGAAFTFEPGTGAEMVSMSFDAGTLGGLSGITQFSAASTVVASEQDGYAKGDLASITIDEFGVINGHYTNSITKTLAQIYLASFNNAGGLEKEGNNLYSRGGNSGQAVVGTAGATIAASVVSGGLEQSNVDLAEEFTNLITTQRGFQASTRIITTSDEMLVETVNLKR